MRIGTVIAVLVTAAVVAWMTSLGPRRDSLYAQQSPPPAAARAG